MLGVHLKQEQQFDFANNGSGSSAVNSGDWRNNSNVNTQIWEEKMRIRMQEAANGFRQEQYIADREPERPRAFYQGSQLENSNVHVKYTDQTPKRGLIRPQSSSEECSSTGDGQDDQDDQEQEDSQENDKDSDNDDEEDSSSGNSDKNSSSSSSESVGEMPFMDLKGMIDVHRRIIKSNRVIIDLAHTKYQVIRDVCEDIFTWGVQLNANNRTDFNIQWIDGYLTLEQFKRMLPFQKINHFPGSQQLGRKNLLGQNLHRMAEQFAEDYDFYPKTWLLPKQFQQLKQFHTGNANKVHGIYSQQQEPSSKQQFYIVKPEASCQGRGIYLTNKIDQLMTNNSGCVVQRYLSNPLLIEGLKFDLRLYVLLKSIQPLKIFLFQEGLARFATVPYKTPSKSNSTNLLMHLTNYALNKKSPNFIQNTNIDEDNVGHKRSFSSVLQHLYEEGHDVESLMMEIRQVIVKTIISGLSEMKQTYSKFQQPSQASSGYGQQPQYQQQTQYFETCFEIYGFDIMIDDNLKPFLIEVNHTPSFQTDSPLDLEVKKHLIMDTLQIVNVSHKHKQKYFDERIKQQIANRSNSNQKKPKQQTTTTKDLSNSHVDITNEDETQEDNQKELQRIQEEIFEFEENHLGAYTRIFPSSSDPLDYQPFLDAAENLPKNSSSLQSSPVAYPMASPQQNSSIIPKSQVTQMSLSPQPENNQQNNNSSIQVSSNVPAPQVQVVPGKLFVKNKVYLQEFSQPMQNQMFRQLNNTNSIIVPVAPTAVTAAVSHVNQLAPIKNTSIMDFSPISNSSNKKNSNEFAMNESALGSSSAGKNNTNNSTNTNNSSNASVAFRNNISSIFSSNATNNLISAVKNDKPNNYSYIGEYSSNNANNNNSYIYSSCNTQFQVNSQLGSLQTSVNPSAQKQLDNSAISPNRQQYEKQLQQQSPPYQQSQLPYSLVSQQGIFADRTKQQQQQPVNPIIFTSRKHSSLLPSFDTTPEKKHISKQQLSDQFEMSMGFTYAEPSKPVVFSQNIPGKQSSPPPSSKLQILDPTQQVLPSHADDTPVTKFQQKHQGIGGNYSNIPSIDALTQQISEKKQQYIPSILEGRMSQRRRRISSIKDLESQELPADSEGSNSQKIQDYPRTRAITTTTMMTSETSQYLDRVSPLKEKILQQQLEQQKERQKHLVQTKYPQIGQYQSNKQQPQLQQIQLLPQMIDFIGTQHDSQSKGFKDNSQHENDKLYQPKQPHISRNYRTTSLFSRNHNDLGNNSNPRQEILLKEQYQQQQEQLNKNTNTNNPNSSFPRLQRQDDGTTKASTTNGDINHSQYNATSVSPFTRLHPDKKLQPISVKRINEIETTGITTVYGLAAQLSEQTQVSQPAQQQQSNMSPAKNSRNNSNSKYTNINSFGDDNAVVLPSVQLIQPVAVFPSRPSRINAAHDNDSQLLQLQPRKLQRHKIAAEADNNSNIY